MFDRSGTTVGSRDRHSLVRPGGCGSLRFLRSSRSSGLRTAAVSRRRLHLDSGLLGLGWRIWRLLLGSRHMGASSGTRFLLDSRLLGLGRQWIFLYRGILG